MTKGRFAILLILQSLIGCHSGNRQIVNQVYIDSLIMHYQDPTLARTNESAMDFWKYRIRPSLPGITSESKYAGTLSLRFHLFGDIRDIQSADSVMRKLDSNFNHREAQADLTLLGDAILQHQFKKADGYLQAAKSIGLKKYDRLTASFDVDFELGRFFNASEELKELKSNTDYGYFFRRSKMDHLNGELDSSIHAMLRAAELEQSSPYLRQVAMSNAADLFIHAGELKKAAELYMQCIAINGADFHSITGLGWIALVHDRNDSLAEKIFEFVHARNRLPDPIFKLTQMSETRGDSVLGKKYAEDFFRLATDSSYGNMYNKYLIELCTGILKDPAMAEKISKKELENRRTPQTYAWYAWSLFSNHHLQEAYDVFAKNVSGKPLEGLELYWMGKVMQGAHKGYNAQSFFKAAYLNQYDLSPVVVKDLEKQLD
jgi:hypothetical protein